jgi:hypothetical protein
MSVPAPLMDLANLAYDHPGLGAWNILHVYRGSIAHGMYEPSTEPTSIDDRDTGAVCVPPLDYYLGLRDFHSRGTQEIKRGEWDVVVYESRKAIRMLAQGNPNVLSMLWTEPGDVISANAAGRLLLDRRDLFAGRHVYQPFVGYAVAQLRKMEGGANRGYMGEKRKRLVERFGYDTKNAAHLIRLLRMGAEFLRDGELHVRRDDAQELLAIRRGEWSLAAVQAEAERLFRRVEDVYAQSTLPERPDRDAVNALAVEVAETALEARRNPVIGNA